MEAKVKNMYTDFVYPKYEEKWDKKAPEIINCRYINLDTINHYIYQGKKNNFNNYRMLFAGAGLGDDLFHMALQLQHYKNIKIVAIDLSPSSLGILKKRLNLYKIENVEIREMSLLDLTPETFGKFDFINCIGVLHHLQNPSDGLRVLNSVLKDDGLMYIMVYAKIGRTGIYQMQDLLRKINKNVEELDYDEKLKRFDLIYNGLPHNNWFKRAEFLAPHHLKGDNGIIDMLLHHQDRAYTIPELYEWVGSENLNIVNFHVENRFKLENRIEGIEFDSKKELYEFNEIYWGDILRHSIYLSKKTDTVVSLDDLDNIPFINYISQDEWDNLIKKLEELGHSYPSPELTFSCDYYCFNNTDKLQETTTKMQIKFKSDFIMTRLLKHIDGKTKIKRLFTKVREELNVDLSNEEMLERFRPIYEAFNMYDALLLKKEDRMISFN